jgi:Glycine/sarcosine/betaine reductase selenoprotein B (GRDB)
MNKIQYIRRTRDFYRAQGFKKDYVWASFDETPFSPLSRSLADCTITLVTTAIVEPDIAKTVRAADSYSFSDVPEDFHTSDLAWDKVTTNTDDRQSYFPLEVLRELAASNKIGELAPRFHFVPTEYSQTNTLNIDAPAILDACRKDKVDIALLVPL